MAKSKVKSKSVKSKRPRASIAEMIAREKKKLRRLEDIKRLKEIREKVAESRRELY
jgi:hypothetical protein